MEKWKLLEGLGQTGWCERAGAGTMAWRAGAGTRVWEGWGRHHGVGGLALDFDDACGSFPARDIV